MISINSSNSFEGIIKIKQENNWYEYWKREDNISFFPAADLKISRVNESFWNNGEI